MNLLYGRIIEFSYEDDMRIGRILVGGAIKKVSLELLAEPRIGDRVLVCDGIAISRDETLKIAEANYVSGNSG
jgi:hydrogenase maturation factor